MNINIPTNLLIPCPPVIDHELFDHLPSNSLFQVISIIEFKQSSLFIRFRVMGHPLGWSGEELFYTSRLIIKTTLNPMDKILLRTVKKIYPELLLL